MQGIESNVKKLNHESVLRLLQHNATSVLSTFDEPQAIMFVVAWRQELGDQLPFGGIAVRPNENTSADLLLNCLKQSTKLCQNICATIDQTQNVKELQKRIIEQEAKIREQEEQIRSLQDKGKHAKEKD